MKKILTLVYLAFCFSFFAKAAENGKLVTYGDGKFEGYLVTPEKVHNKTPAILMIHNWLGVTDETKFQAQRFAKLGYIVLELDIYGKGIRPANSEEAGKLSAQYKKDRQLFRERLNLGLKFLSQDKSVDKSKIVAVGYCFGGTGAIELARSGADIKAVISFHGGLDSPAPQDGKNIKAQIVAHHGADDPYVKVADIAAFEKEMNDNHVKYQLIKYPGAVHSFTEKGAGNDNSKGAAYNKEADEKSFAAAESFLQQIFK